MAKTFQKTTLILNIFRIITAIPAKTAKTTIIKIHSAILTEFIHIYFFPNNNFNKIFPSFRSIPLFEVGTPVLRAKLCFALVIPIALFNEKENPKFLLMIKFLICYTFNVCINSFGNKGKFSD